jgi:hypothetical protein
MSTNHASTVSMDLPHPWEPVPVEPDEYARWVKETLASVEGTEEDKHEIEVGFRSLLVESRAEGLVWAAGFCEQIPSETAAGGQRPIAASAFIGIRPAPELEGAMSSVAWLAALRSAEVDGELRALRDAEIVTIGGYEAVKSVAIERLPADQVLPEMFNYSQTYYLSSLEHGLVVAVGFRSPCIWLIDSLEPLFDAIADTLALDL